jgi:predicted acetylornithine/succinylornithine family transaminase
VIGEQAKELIHVSNLYFNPPMVELAELLIQNSFASRVFFCNSGAEANEGAVKLARKYFKKKGQPGRFRMITMQNSFHGRTLAMISATGQEKVKKGFEPMVEGFSQVPYGDLASLEKAITSETAAVLLELVQGEGGVVFATDDYLKRVRALCDRHGILLIYDEVQTGMGRTGKLFAYEHSGVIPDILTLAKGLAGGVPIGAILAKEEVAQAFEPGNHAATFGGNPLAARAALEVIRILQEELLQNCQEVGVYFLERLRVLQKKHSQISEVRGQGLMIAIELKESGKEIVSKAMEKGVLLNCTQERVLRFVPPLILSKEEVDFAIKNLDEIIP